VRAGVSSLMHRDGTIGCLLGWVGSVVSPRWCHRASPSLPRGCAVNPRALHELYGQELAELLDTVLAGDLVTDWASIERRVVRALGALVRLQQRHKVAEHSRCSICRSVPRGWWLWPKHTTCTVHNALSSSLRQPERLVPSIITENAATVGGRS
jgi:hypothetical protein